MNFQLIGPPYGGGRFKAIRPVGMCFLNAFTALMEWELEGSRFPGVYEHSNPRLVHGICWTNDDQVPRRTGHAWLEFDQDGLRWGHDATYGVTVPAVLFRKEGRAEYATEYTANQAALLFLERGFCGPWDKRIEDLYDLRTGDLKGGGAWTQ